MNDNTEILKELMAVKSERDALKTERAEIIEQVNNLGKYIGRPGMTAAHIVSEAVSKIEKLQGLSPRVMELETALRDLLEWDNFPPSFSRRDCALQILGQNATSPPTGGKEA